MNKKGFTLAELLIVVAIIAVLVVIAIPIFTKQLERSREATDLANVRSAYAEVMTAAASNDTSSPVYKGDGTYQSVVSPLKQKEDGWATNVDNIEIGGVPSSTWIGEPTAGGSCTVSFNTSSEKVTINWGGSGGGTGGDTPGGDGGDTPGGDGGGGDDPASETAAPLDSAIKSAAEAALLNLIGTPHGSQRLTVTISNGTVSVNTHGNPSERVTEASVINVLRSLPGVTFDSSGKMYSNGHPVTDTIAVHYTPSGH
ncbi:MAG: prepilin-type N-terminal cleavage/methylation domain-containing protein [Eubacterium sp.]|nr:prepilin-type N-terminal cleavage/methylation domain-containing protein [Eubacterium sp.]